MSRRYIKRGNASSVQAVNERNVHMKAAEFLKRSAEPFIKNLKETVDLIREWKDEKFTIVGDYDADGICAAAIMVNGFRYFGIEPKVRLPRRFSEGYGLSVKIIDEIDEGVVLTVDNGIAAGEAIDAAKAKGLKVIVTDHHMAPVDENENLVFPNADIIVDPSTEEESEFHNYCGAAIAYRIIKELCPDRDLTRLLVLASIATVSDVMPLIGPNRDLVIDGLEAINKGKVVPGLAKIIEEAKLGEHITEDEYGFKLGPIFNATGRIYDDGAERVLRVLLSERGDPALPWLVKRLVDTNNKRKNIVAESMGKIDVDARPIVCYNPEFPEGIIGILAGKLSEAYKCPAIVFTKTESGFLKGSGRSIPEKNLKEILDKMQDVMVGYGGHAGAAGLTIEADKLDEFKKAFKKAVGRLPSDHKAIYYDLDIEPDQVAEICEEVKAFAPYGEGNPKPIFRMKYGFARKARFVGANKEHFSLTGDNIKLIGFGLANNYEELNKPKSLDLVGTVDESWYRGRMTPQFEIIDMKEVEQEA